MIFVDNREGSSDLIEPLTQLGLPVQAVRLDFGDVAFEGRGEGGTPLWIGIEFKQLDELVAAMRSERLQGWQMPGMRDVYAHSYLFIEGELLYDRQGRLVKKDPHHFRKRTILPGRMTVSELLKRIFVLHLCGGLNPWWTTNRADTVQGIQALYRTWTDQDLDRHSSHLAIYNAPQLFPISETRRVLSTFPHIGRKLSAVVEQHFGTLERATTATVEDWAHICTTGDDGRTRRLGTKIATDIVEFCQGKKGTR